MTRRLDQDLLVRTRDAVNADPSFRKLGSTDLRLGIRSGERAFLVSFVAFECAAVEATEPDGLCDADLTLELPEAGWGRYLTDRAAGRAPSLLSLDLDTDGGIVRGADPRRTLGFERYAATLQAFFDRAAALAA
jgi:hypothetical protein